MSRLETDSCRSGPDWHRPRYHFSPDNWMNDPMPFFWQGRWHLFYQHNAHGAFWGSICWGHASSRDLLHWEQHPVALWPGPEDLDRAGVFTGSVVEHSGTFYAFYTAVSRLEPLTQTQCLATSTDLVRWQKYPGNPLLSGPPVDLQPGDCFRDPLVLAHGGGWLMLVGSQLPDGQGGAVLLYRSSDLLTWQYEGIAATGTPDTGHDAECPDLFPVGRGHMLVTSRHRSWWHFGTFNGQRLDIFARGALDGPGFYAARSAAEPSGRLLWGWLPEGREGSHGIVAAAGGDARPSAGQQGKVGWSGVLSMPRRILPASRPPRCLPANHPPFRLEPTGIYESLRGRMFALAPRSVRALQRGGHEGEVIPLLAGVGHEFELELRFSCSDDLDADLLTGGSPDLLDGARVPLVPSQPYILSSAGAADSDTAASQRHCGRGNPSGGPSRLRVFQDHSVIESQLDGNWLTLRHYAAQPDHDHLALWVRQGELHLHSGRIWLWTQNRC